MSWKEVDFEEGPARVTRILEDGSINVIVDLGEGCHLHLDVYPAAINERVAYTFAVANVMVEDESQPHGWLIRDRATFKARRTDVDFTNRVAPATK